MQEQAAVARDGLGAAEQVLERRGGRAGRMARLLRLLELLRVAEQHEALGAGRDGEHVGERHLAGFVDEQHVDAVAEALVRPEPRRAAEQAILVGREQPRDAIVVVDGVQRLGVVVFRLAFVQALKIREPLLCRALADGAQHVADRLVADGRDADFLAGLHELENHVRARERLAGAGRALDRQHAVVELEREANGVARPRRRQPTAAPRQRPVAARARCARRRTR